MEHAYTSHIQLNDICLIYAWICKYTIVTVSNNNNIQYPYREKIKIKAFSWFIHEIRIPFSKEANVWHD